MCESGREPVYQCVPAALQGSQSSNRARRDYRTHTRQAEHRDCNRMSVRYFIWSGLRLQSRPQQGDWYANTHYNCHAKTYRHPSQFGYNDICRLWSAENWNYGYGPTR